ncbi:hypothetical protein ACFX1X_005671 [Malus domestica]
MDNGFNSLSLALLHRHLRSFPIQGPNLAPLSHLLHRLRPLAGVIASANRLSPTLFVRCLGTTSTTRSRLDDGCDFTMFMLSCEPFINGRAVPYDPTYVRYSSSSKPLPS